MKRGSAWGRKKTNEIKAIPGLLDCLNIKGTIITADAMGTQTAVVKKIRQKHADYVLALKANQGNLLEDVRLYFSDREHLQQSACKKTTEKARGKIEKREYWQTDNISWLEQKKDWAGLKTVILTRNTITGEEGEESVEERYFISSLPLGIEETVRAVRGHWMAESRHWYLDVTFREDGNHTLERQAAYNLNIIRKLSLNILKRIEIGSRALSLKKLYDLSDERLVSCVQTDMAFQYFLDLKLGSPMIGSCFLTKFRKTRITEDILEKMLKETIQQALEKGLIRSGTIIVDSTHTNASIRAKFPTQILRDLSRQLRKEIYKNAFELSEKFPEKPSIEAGLDEGIVYTQKLLSVLEEGTNTVGNQKIQKLPAKIPELLETKKFVRSVQKMIRMPGLDTNRQQVLFMGIKTIWQ